MKKNVNDMKRVRNLARKRDQCSFVRNGFLDANSSNPLIIDASLNDDGTSNFLHDPTEYLKTLGYSKYNIKGTIPNLCMYRTHLYNNVNPPMGVR